MIATEDKAYRPSFSNLVQPTSREVGGSVSRGSLWLLLLYSTILHPAWLCPLCSAYGEDMSFKVQPAPLQHRCAVLDGRRAGNGIVVPPARHRPPNESRSGWDSLAFFTHDITCEEHGDGNGPEYSICKMVLRICFVSTYPAHVSL